MSRRTPAPQLTNVPSLAERSGDFSGVRRDNLTIRSPPAQPEFRPLASRAVPPTRSTFAMPSPETAFLAKRFNTVGKSRSNAYPAPNTGAAAAISNNFIASPNLSEDHFRN